MFGFILTLILCVPVETIYWEIVNPPMRYGDDVQLVCSITCCPDVSTLSTYWAIEDEHLPTSISHNTLAGNSKKYEILTSSHACRLEIKKFGPEDANKNYTCFHGFERFSKNLTLDINSFEHLPVYEDISSFEYTNDNMYYVAYNFSNVFPEPMCEAYFKENNLTSMLKTSQSKNGSFFNTRILMQLPIMMGTLNITCKIGEKSYNLKEVQFFDTHNETSNDGVVVTLIVTTILFIISAVLNIRGLLRRNCPKGELEIVDVHEINQLLQETKVKKKTVERKRYFSV